jgi:hypothetical protein
MYDAREILRLDFENTLEHSRGAEATASLKSLIETVDQIPTEIFDIFTELVEELPDSELLQDMLGKVSEGRWLPKTATEFVERFISRTTGAE